MKYEFTRNEIYQWLKEQNWECKKLEEILLKENLIDRVDKTSMDYINKSLLENMLSKEKKTKETENKPKRAVNKDNVQEFVDLNNGKTRPEKIESTMDLAEQGSLGSHAIYINEAIEKINEIIDFLSTKDKEEK